MPARATCKPGSKRCSGGGGGGGGGGGRAGRGEGGGGGRHRVAKTPTGLTLPMQFAVTLHEDGYNNVGMGWRPLPLAICPSSPPPPATHSQHDNRHMTGPCLLQPPPPLLVADGHAPQCAAAGCTASCGARPSLCPRPALRNPLPPPPPARPLTCTSTASVGVSQRAPDWGSAPTRPSRPRRGRAGSSSKPNLARAGSGSGSGRVEAG